MAVVRLIFRPCVWNHPIAPERMSFRFVARNHPMGVRFVAGSHPTAVRFAARNHPMGVRFVAGNHPSGRSASSANSAPSPLSLRDISPPRGESPLKGRQA